MVNVGLVFSIIDEIPGGCLVILYCFHLQKILRVGHITYPWVSRAVVIFCLLKKTKIYFTFSFLLFDCWVTSCTIIFSSYHSDQHYNGSKPSAFSSREFYHKKNMIMWIKKMVSNKYVCLVCSTGYMVTSLLPVTVSRLAIKISGRGRVSHLVARGPLLIVWLVLEVLFGPLGIRTFICHTWFWLTWWILVRILTTDVLDLLMSQKYCSISAAVLSSSHGSTFC